MLQCLFRTMHVLLKSHSSIIKKKVKFANFCHDWQWLRIFHYTLVAVFVAGSSITEHRNKRRKKPLVCHRCLHRATNTLNSRYCSLCSRATSDKGAVSTTEYEGVICHYITVQIGRANSTKTNENISS